MKTEIDNVKIIGGTFEDATGKSNQTYNKYDKKSREKVMDAMLPDGHGKKLLDLGCSIGAWGQYLQKRGYADLHGVDLSAERLETAKQRGYQIHQCHGTKTPYPDASFDVVICIDVLVHVIEEQTRQEMMREAHRILKPNGLFIFSIANSEFNELSKKWDLYLPKHKRGFVPEYVRLMTLRRAAAMVEESGFEILETTGIQFITPSILVKFPCVLEFLDAQWGKTRQHAAKTIFFKTKKVKK